jgi:hypothetical protein
MTILAGVLAFFVMVDRPEQAGKWLTPEEKAYVVWRKESDGSTVGEAKHISWKCVHFFVLPLHLASAVDDFGRLDTSNLPSRTSNAGARSASTLAS